MIKNYYKILNVSKSASKQEIKSAYRKLIKFWHPDVNSNPRAHDKLVEINEAYELDFATFFEESSNCRNYYILKLKF